MTTDGRQEGKKNSQIDGWIQVQQVLDGRPFHVVCLTWATNLIESPIPHCAQPCFKDHQTIKNDLNMTDRVMQLGGTSQMKAIILGFTLKPSTTSYLLSLPKFSLSEVNNHIPKPHHELSVAHPNCKKNFAMTPPQRVPLPACKKDIPF